MLPQPLNPFKLYTLKLEKPLGKWNILSDTANP